MAYENTPRAQVTLMFGPGLRFPACHASCVTSLDNGDILCVYFGGAHEKADDVGIWLSARRGGVWQAPECIAKLAPVAHWNPVIFHTADGLTVTFRVGSEISAWQTYEIRSADGGLTWSQPAALCGNFGPVRSKPIRLSDGRLLAPDSDETETTWRTRVDVSEDDGRTFAKLADIPLPQMDGKGAIQPALWQDAGGIHALLRTTCGKIYRSDSADGSAWCTAYDTGMPNNNSGLDVAYVNGRLFLIMNPVSGNWAARTPLILFESADGGKSFEPIYVLADAPDGEFSYPSLYWDGKLLRVSFTDRRRSIAYAEISI